MDEKQDTQEAVKEDTVVMQQIGASFLTGSRVYGVPQENSDIDLVVFLQPDEMGKLREIAEEDSEQFSDPPGSVSIKFGRLNLICADSLESLKVWQEGTHTLKLLSPVTRGEAVGVFYKLRKRAGII